MLSMSTTASVRCFAVLAVLAAAGVSQAHVTTYFTTLSGPAESPPNNSPGTGYSIVDIDDDNFLMRVRVVFSGLTANTTVAHIHGPTSQPGTGTAGVMTPTPTFPGFPIGTSGSYDVLFDMTLSSSYGSGFFSANGSNVVTAFASLTSAISSGRAYMNVHSSAFPGGEIRGFYAVPAPSAAALLGLGGLVMARRRR